MPHPGRLSVELRPAVAIDKGTVVRESLTPTARPAACFFGDDLGDLLGVRRARQRRAAAGRDHGDLSGSPSRDVEAAPEAWRTLPTWSWTGPVGALAVLAWLEEHTRPVGDGDSCTGLSGHRRYTVGGRPAAVRVSVRRSAGRPASQRGDGRRDGLAQGRSGHRHRPLLGPDGERLRRAPWPSRSRRTG